VTVQAEYPSYLARATETLAAGEPLRVPRGTALVLRGRASVPLQRVALMGAAGVQPITLPARGHVFEGRFVPTASGRWTWRADGEGGAVGEVPAPFDVQLLSDSAPIVVLASPGQDSTIDGVSGLRARVLASDDHGLASVALRTWVERADGTRRRPRRRRSAARPRVDGRGRDRAVGAGAQGGRQAARAGRRHRRLAVAAGRREPRGGAQGAVDERAARDGARLRRLRGRGRQRARRGAARAAAPHRRGRALAHQPDRRPRQGNQGDQQPQMGYQQAERARGLAQEQRQLASRTQQLQEQAKSLERQLAQAGRARHLAGAADEGRAAAAARGDDARDAEAARVPRAQRRLAVAERRAASRWRSWRSSSGSCASGWRRAPRC
jgi:hypothetical protein